MEIDIVCVRNVAYSIHMGTLWWPQWAIWGRRAVLAACVLIVLIFGLTQAKAHLDDAYITYRYALNLAQGQGFVYNRGEAVLGTTAPLYGLLLALLHVAGVDIPLASHWMSVLGWAMCVLLVERIGTLGTTHGRPLGLVAAALVATSPLFLQVIGMETNLIVALALGALYLYMAGHPNTAFLVAALATWMRPDCALVAVVLGVAFVLERRAAPWRGALIFVGTLLPWLVFAQSFYGSVLPNTLYAKAGQGHSLLSSAYETFGWGLVRWSQHWYSTGKLYVFIGLWSLAGLFDIVMKRSRCLILVAWTGLYIVSYMILGVTHFSWYYPPLWPAIALLTVTGILVTARWGQRFNLPMWFQWAVTLLLSVAILIVQIQGLWRSRLVTVPPYNRHYISVAEWLRANTAPDASVALIEIGIIGYYSGRQVVDTMGLVSPGMKGHLYSWGQTVIYALTHYWPDYAVALKGTAWDEITSAMWFQEAYAPVATIPNAGPGSRTAMIYKRVAGMPVRTFELNRSYDLSADDTVGLSAIRVQKEQLQPGQMLHVQVEWRARRSTRHDIKVQIDLVNAQDGQRRTLAIEQPMRGGNPTFLWQPGEVILDNYSLRLPLDLEPGVYLLKVELLDLTDDRWLAFTNTQGKTIPHVSIGPLWAGKAVSPDVSISIPVSATFGSIEFLGYDLARSDFAAGETIPLVLYWRANQPVEDDYTVFTHIIDAQGQLVAQQDNVPLHGKLPTTLWLPGIALRDDYQIALPFGLPAGEYSVQIGLYKFNTGERLPPHSSVVQVFQHALQLTRITVR